MLLIKKFNILAIKPIHQNFTPKLGYTNFLPPITFAPYGSYNLYPKQKQPGCKKVRGQSEVRL